jgi:hypothetical protein
MGKQASMLGIEYLRRTQAEVRQAVCPERVVPQDRMY